MNTRINLAHRKLLPLALAVLGLAALSVAAAASEGTSDPVVIGQKFSMQSKILGEHRRYWVHTPPRYEFRTRAYPILILLDGDGHFAHTSAAVDFLARNERIPEMIVVGVLNTNRGRDLTPPPSSGSGGPNPGGADKFLAFLGDELIPEIESRYRTQPYRVIVGHSLGGLFAVYALIERPKLFNAYLPISPSLWVEDQALVKKSEAFLAKHSDLRADIYMTMGNEGNAMLGGFWKLSALLEEKRPANLRWQIKRSPEETHGSVPYRSTYDGLEAIFQGWLIQDPVALYEQGGLASLEKHYAKISERMGYPINVQGNVYGSILDSLTRQKRNDEAEALLHRALQDYPRHPQARQSLAGIYVGKKEEDKARAELAKVIEIYPGWMQARTLMTKLNGTVPSDTDLTAKQMDALAGEYRGPDGSIFIAAKDNKLSVASPAGTCELRALSESRLYCVDADVEFTVNREKSGRVASIRVEYPDYQFPAMRVKSKAR